jgi:predicted nucleic acid-binding protein
MTYLFDASSLLLLIKQQGPKAADTLKNSATVPLIYYEIGNTLRTSAAVHKHITAEEAQATLKNIHQALALTKEITQNTHEESRLILQNSLKHNITYYDSAYLTAAQTNNHTLVTEDRQLTKAAQKANTPTTKADSLTNNK